MNKLTKILLLALTLLLVIGASVAVVASAEDEVLPTIIGKNLVYTDMTAIQIAVDPATVDAKDVKLLATVDGKTATYTSYEVSTDSDVAGAYVFTIKGIPASAISDEVTIVVESGDKASEPFTYSVAEYFYERLYSDGIVNATEGKNAARKEFYETYIANGAAAQELFRNYDKNGNYVGGTTLVTDYTVLAIEKGTLENGKEIILSATDALTSKVTANAALAADKRFTNEWKVTTYGETVTTTTVKNGEEATAVAGYLTSVTPVYTDATGDFFNSDLKGTRYDFDSDSAPLLAFQSGGTTASIANVDGSIEYKVLEKGGSTCRWTPGLSSKNMENPVLVFETDIMFKDITSTTFGWLILANGGKQAPQITFNRNNDNTISVYTGSSPSNGVKIAAGQWGNLRIACDFNAGTISFYVNNQLEGTVSATFSDSGSTMARFSLVSSANVGDTILMDNIYYGIVDRSVIAAN
jgi:hypothetical protein